MKEKKTKDPPPLKIEGQGSWIGEAYFLYFMPHYMYFYVNNAYFLDFFVQIIYNINIFNKLVVCLAMNIDIESQ